jgi:hypothetical protein
MRRMWRGAEHPDAEVEVRVRHSKHKGHGTNIATNHPAPRKHTRTGTRGHWWRALCPTHDGSPWVELRLERLVEHHRYGWDGTRVMNERIIANHSSLRG